MKISYMLMAMILGFSSMVKAQDITITGMVTSSEDQSTLPGVNIVVKGTAIGTITDLDGKYSLDVSGTESILVFSSVGFVTQEITVGSQTVIGMVLRIDIAALEEVVVIGYGTVRKSDLTGSVSSIKAEQIATLTINSVQQALAGQVPGVAVSTGTAMPGGGISIRIRGSNSISSNNEPLYVIDGFPVFSNSQSIPSGNKGNTVLSNPLATLNPNDIESIEVLKDASATAIYGSRGANGVILITTKTGIRGKTNVTIDAYYGVQQVQKLYDVLEAPEFIIAKNERALETGGEIPFPDGTDFYTGDVNTNWQDEIYRTAPVQNYQVSVLSGNDKSRTSFSLGYFDQQGIVKSSGFQRFSTRLNTDYNIGNKLNIGGNISFARIINNRVPTEGTNNQNAGPTNVALFQRPTLPIFNPDGTYTQMGVDGSSALQGGQKENPIAQINEIENVLKKDDFFGNVYFTYDILPGLKWKSSVGVNLSNSKRNYYASRLTNRGGRGLGGRATISDAQVESILNENTLSYEKSFGQIHRINAVAGYTIQKETTTRSSMDNTKFPNDITKTNDIGAGTQEGGPGIWSSKADWRMVSYLARVNYVLMDKYLFTATVRSDGSSKFGVDNKWATFPSAAVAWRVSEEGFMQGTGGWLSDMKIRASWGQVGNSEIGSYRSLSTFNTVSYSYGGTIVSAFYPNRIGNPALVWETTEQTNIGVDIGFIDNRITFTFDWYDKMTDMLLLDITLPHNTGHGSAQSNFGNVANRGYEVAIGADIFVNTFKWRSDFNLSHNVNEVTNLGELGRIFGANVSGDFKWNSASMVTEGEPMGVFYGFRTGGVFKDWEDVQTWQNGFMYNADDPDKGAQPGDRKYYDIPDEETGEVDGELTVDDREIIGNPHPDFIFGFTNTFSYNNWSLNVFLQGASGHDVLNVNRWQLYTDGGGENIEAERHAQRWTPENTDAKWPRYGNPTPVSENIQDWVLEDASYVRIRNITLSYNFPMQNVDWMEKMRIYLATDNPVLITKYSGYDPDVNSMMGGGRNTSLGIDNGSYPSARVYKLGLNFTF